MDQEYSYDGDTAFRQLVMLMRGDDIQYSTEENYSYTMRLRSVDETIENNLLYAQFIRDGIVCVSFVAVILIVLIIISVRNNVSYFSTRQEEQRQISQFTDVTTSNLSHETVVDIDGGTSFIKTLKEGVCEV